LHGLFKCLLTPKEQLSYIVSLCSPVLSDLILEDLYDILSKNDQEFYKEGITRNKKNYE